MSNEILVNITPQETRVAVVEDGVVEELILERSAHRALVGNIYCGKVMRVLPGMQAAFVDIGLEKAGFIRASDVCQETPSKDIRVLLREGQSLVVQILKDPIATKGARLTAFLSLPSRFLVYMPHLEGIGVSQKVESEEERLRLKTLVEQLIGQNFASLTGNFIIRTAAENVAAAELETDIRYLQRLWGSLQEAIEKKKIGTCIYQNLPLSLRILRDRVGPKTQKIRVDSYENLQKMQQFCQSFLPSYNNLLERYQGDRPLFDVYRIEDEIKAALDRNVSLPSGGYLVIDQTEAMTTIDVNTGAFVGYSNLEETTFKTNLEAATVLARQLRVRNIGGIIIVDFINMHDEEHQQQLLRTLEKALEKDYTRVSISGVTELGLVQIVRKKTRESLEQMLCEVCPSCQGSGMVKSIETVCYEIFRAILREARTYDHDNYLILASQQVVDYLLDEESAKVADLEQFIGKTLRFQVESQYQQKQFNIVLL